MPQINEWTMILAIRLVAAEIRVQREVVTGENTMAEEFRQLEDLLKAADDLERAYDIAAQTMLNLPPYDELVDG